MGVGLCVCGGGEGVVQDHLQRLWGWVCVCVEGGRVLYKIIYSVYGGGSVCVWGGEGEVYRIIYSVYGGGSVCLCVKGGGGYAGSSTAFMVVGLCGGGDGGVQDHLQRLFGWVCVCVRWGGGGYAGSSTAFMGVDLCV